MQWTQGEFTLDDDFQRIDMPRLLTWLQATYWARNQPEWAIRRSWEKAGITLGLYHGEEMIGAARAITDFARTAYLSDVYVDPAYRGKGLGQWIVQTMLDHPNAPGVRWILHSSDARDFYRPFGFEQADEIVMQRPRPPRQ